MKDRYGREITYMRVSVTDLCNLRCRYCMPEQGVEKRSHFEMLSREELMNAVDAAAKLGIKKIRITGGEPLVKRGILDICRSIKTIKGIDELCLTTNGVLLESMATDLKKAGVDRINISLDTLRADRYRYITRIGDIEDVLAGIRACREAGFQNLKINTVLSKGFNDDEICDFVEMTRSDDLCLRFIELMPMGKGVSFNKGGYISLGEVLERVPELTPVWTTKRAEGEDLEIQRDGVAAMYRLPNGKGSVGLIRTISCGFCDGCNKIRLTADGNIKPCLHSKEEYSLKGKTPDDMKAMMQKAIDEKPKERGALGGKQYSKSERNMNQIGG